MLLWLLLAYLSLAMLMGILLGTAIRMQGGGSSAGRPSCVTAPRQAAAGAGARERAGLGVRVAAGR